MPVSEATYEQLALEDREGKWELLCGRPQRKPDMTTEHEDIARTLLRFLVLQLSEEFSVGQDSPKLHVPGGNYRIPDVCVVPRALIQRRKQLLPAKLEVYDEPMPLVVEVWSPSTGGHDSAKKVLEYQKRGDLEIWRIHPYERTLIALRRQPDGSYTETPYTEGTVPALSLPGVAIELDALFD
jgi:Uma2 family endonuclease